MTDAGPPAQAFDRLVAAWLALRSASRRMVDAPAPAWPWDRESPEFLANQRRRDEVQGKGMRFAALWRERADDVRALVASAPAAFAAYHEIQKDGTTIDPADYMQASRVMPSLIDVLADRTA